MGYYDGDMFNSVQDAINKYTDIKKIFNDKTAELEKSKNWRNDEVYKEIDILFRFEEHNLNDYLETLLSEMGQAATILATEPVKYEGDKNIYIKDFEALSNEMQEEIILNKINELYCNGIPNKKSIHTDYICFLTQDSENKNTFIFNFNKRQDTTQNLIKVPAILRNDCTIKINKPVYSTNFKEIAKSMTDSDIANFKKQITDTVLRFKRNSETIIKSSLAIKINHFKSAIADIEEELSLTTDKPFLGNLIDVLEAEGNYQICRKNNTVYFIEDDDTIIYKLPISKLMDGKLPRQIISDDKADELFDYETNDWLHEQLDFDLMELFDDVDRTEYYDIFKNWINEKHYMSADAVGYFSTLFGWYKTGEVKPMTKAEITELIPVADEDTEELIAEYNESER